MLLDYDEDLSLLLNKRFHSTQKKWLKSLESMPVGVMIYDTAKGQVDFENKMLDQLFRSQELADKYDAKLKSYA